MSQNERLTERYGKYIRVKGTKTMYDDTERKSAPAANAIVRLAAYEDKGLLPDDVPTALEMAKMYAALKLLEEYREIGEPEDLRELKASVLELRDKLAAAALPADEKHTGQKGT